MLQLELIFKFSASAWIGNLFEFNKNIRVKCNVQNIWNSTRSDHLSISM